jgi:sarcosine oxidase
VEGGAVREKVDVIVIGGGPVGLAAAAEAARRAKSVLVLERRDFHGDHGGSGGAERQWRLQYAEQDLATLTRTARAAWRELEAGARRRLIHETGSLWFGDTATSSSEGQIKATVEVLDRLGIGYRGLDSTTLRQEYGFDRLPATYEGIFQPEGGVIDVAAARWSLLDQAARLGCALHGGEQATEVAPDGAGVTVRTTRGRYRCDQVIVAAGAWTAPLLDRLGVRLELTTYRLARTHFRLRTARDYPTWFAFQNRTEEDSNLFYGFGRMPWAGDDLVQVSPLFEADPLADPADGTHAPREHDLRRAAGWVRDHMPDLEPEPVGASTCVVALPADHGRQFYIGSARDTVPDGERIVVSAGGWAFKFAPVFGKACVDLALDGRTGDALARSGLGVR